MGFHYFIALFILLGITPCYAADTLTQKIESPSSISSFEGMPSGIIGGHVNTATGEFVDFEADLAIPGLEPLVLQRSYSSKCSFGLGLGLGWNLNHYMGGSGNYNFVVLPTTENEDFSLNLSESSGAIISYSGYVKKGYTWDKLQRREIKGLTNCGSGEISGQTSMRNLRAKINSCKNHPDHNCYLRNGAGDERYYTYKLKDGNIVLTLRADTKITGHKIRYDYTDNEEFLRKITSGNLNEQLSYSWIDVDLDWSIKDSPKVSYTSNDGKKAIYHLNSNHNNRFQPHLKRVERDSRPPLTYEHYTTSQGAPIISKKSLGPQNQQVCIVEADYYKQGHNERGKRGNLDLKRKDSIIDKVKMLKAPVGTDSTPLMTYLFDYFDDATDVFDALYHKSIYTYDKEQRLCRIDKHEGVLPANTLYSTQQFLWQPKGDHTGNLICTLLKDKNGRLWKATKLGYDDEGNVRVEQLHGNITGLSPNLSIQGDIPAGADCYERIFTYNSFNLALNLMTSCRNNSNTKRTQYTYVSSTNRLESELVFDDQQIKIRTFYDYDSNGCLAAKIIDDGCTTDKNNLTGVTQRLITRIKNRTSIPAFGLPESHEDYYLDFASGEEKLLKRFENSYTSHGLLETQSHYDGNRHFLYTLTWRYDTHGNVTEEKDAFGYQIIREYDDFDNLKEEYDSKTGVKVENDYDFSHRLIARREIHPDGEVFISKFKYNLLSQCISKTDHFGNETKHEYDEFGREICAILPVVQDETGGTLYPTIRKTYDILDHVTSVTDAKGYKTETSYTIQGKPITIKYPDGTSEHYEYALDGTLVKSVAKNGVITKITTDFLGRPTRTETWTSNHQLYSYTTAKYSAFNLESSTDAEGNETLFTYDGAGRKASMRTASCLTEYCYDARGNLHKTIQHYGPDQVTVKVEEHDLIGRVTEERIEDGHGQILRKENYGYDRAGNRETVIKWINNSESSTITTYNSHKLPELITDAAGNKTHIEYDYHFKNELDQYVLKTITTDPLGYRLVVVMDAQNRPTVQEKTTPFGDVISRQEITYDSIGRKTRLKHTVFTPGAPNREVINAWEYNPMGEVVKVIEALGTEDQKVTSSLFNTLGQKTEITKPNGTVLKHTYDLIGRLETFSAKDQSFSYVYAYNKNHQLVSVKDLILQLTTTRDYDPNNNLKSEVLSHGLKIGYDYDGIDRPVRVTLPDETAIALDYNASQLKAVRRLSKSNEELYVHRYLDYDLAGNLVKAQMLGTLGHLQFSYDILGRNTEVKAPYWSQTVAEEGFDQAGNLLALTTQDAKGTVDSLFTYDALNQLKSERGLAHHDYLHDSLYNRVSKDGAEHKVNALNQLRDDSKSTYAYDKNGNLKEKQNGTAHYQYIYDALDRLISVTKGSEQTRYTYDFLNRRLSKESFEKEGDLWKSRATTRFLYQGQNEIGAVDESGKIVELRVLGLSRGAEIGAAIAHELHEEILAPLHDLSGNVTCLVNPDKEIYVTYRYSAFGEVRTAGYAGANPWQFSSKRYDPETGFNNFGRRYYSAEIGRWLTADPLGFDGGPNLYAYVLNNPLTHMDLYGLEAISWMNRGYSAMRTLAQVPGHLMTLCSHVMPMPSVADLFAKTSRFLRSKGFTLENSKPHSHACRTEGHRNIPGVSFYFANGILNSAMEASDSCKNVANALGNLGVNLLYNASHSFFSDLFECVAQRIGIPTRSVDVMVDTIRATLKKAEGGEIYLFAHSQGGLITHRALQQLSDAEKARIHVITFGSAKMITDKRLASAKNYVSTRDSVPFISDPINTLKARFFGSEHVEFLKSKGLPFFDHSFDNGVYSEALSQEGLRIQQNLQARR